jgi:hypothetical protein
VGRINLKLFPYLKKFANKKTAEDTENTEERNIEEGK